jgi:autotransporter-associated beta strand protein
MNIKLLVLSLILPFALDAQAGSATWNLNPASGDWNTATNWSPNTVPNGPSDVATFADSNQTDVSLSAVTEIDSIVFNPGARSFTITNAPFHEFTISGAGIINNSGVTQHFISDKGSGSFGDRADSPAFPSITFTNNATAGSNTTFTINGANGELGVGGNVDFYDSTSADHASFEIFGSRGYAYGTELGFYGSSTAANATISIHERGELQMSGFESTPTLADAVVTNTRGFIYMYSGASAGQAIITNIGTMTVTGTATAISTAGSATIINQGGFGDTKNGTILFGNWTTADNAVITNNGGQGSAKLGGLLTFTGEAATAYNATLIANPGTNGGGGGAIIFDSTSLGGTARCEVFGNGSLDISQHDAPGVTIGSLEGDGLVFLGADDLTIGSNNLSTVFSGVIQDSGVGGGADGSLTKIGNGTLTLSGANTYTGGTTVSDGTLAVSNTTHSGTGSGAVVVSGGTLAGNGTIAGAVTVGGDSLVTSFLSPGSRQQATLTIQGSLTFSISGTYNCSYKGKGRRVQFDQVVANGVTIQDGTGFNFPGTTRGAFRLGIVLTVISNTSTTPITGTFSNLPDGSIFAAEGGNFQANYEGGDGNDLTLTVVP